MVERRKSPTVVDLFAGCGGLSLGLENAGFEPVFVNELNPDAMESYLLNRDHLKTNLAIADATVSTSKPLHLNQAN